MTAGGQAVEWRDAKREGKADIEQLLQSGQAIQIRPQGYSMYPMFVPGRDQAIIEPLGFREIKRGDVVLYRRDQFHLDQGLQADILVLHRVCKVKKDGFYMAGDNQSKLEGPLERRQIKGVLAAFIRNGSYISVNNPIYRALSWLWMTMRPFRMPLMRHGAALKRKMIKK